MAKNLPNKFNRIFCYLAVIILFLFLSSCIEPAADKIELAKSVNYLRTQLKILIDSAHEKDPKFKVRNIQLKLQVCYESSVEGEMSIWVLTGGADVSKAVTHEITLNLELNGEGYVYKDLPIDESIQPDEGVVASEVIAETIDEMIPPEALFIVVSGGGYTDFVKDLVVNEKVNVNAVNEKGESALIKATEYNHSETVEYLLEAGTSTSIITNDNKTALKIAREKGYKDIELLLVQFGATE